MCRLNMDGDELDGSLVERLHREVTEHGTKTPRMVVDCSRITKLTPQGLSALLELGGRVSGMWQVALAALPRPFLRQAIEVGLAERFPIYTSVEAAERALADSEA